MYVKNYCIKFFFDTRSSVWGEYMNVIKRDGTFVEYDLEKISIAISGAFEELGREFNDAILLQEIEDIIFKNYKDKITVEEIQDIVEIALMDNGYVDEAKAYILYRYNHELARQKYTDQEILTMIKGDNDYWKGENSNKNPDLVTVQRDYLAGITSTDIARKYIFSKRVVDAHDKGWVHQHDMDYMAQATLHNCDVFNLEDMLQNGTVINNIKINKPHRLATAMTIATQIMAAVASSQYGGQTISLAHLAPFVRDSYNIFLEKYRNAGLDEDKCIELADIDLKKEVADAVQTFNYQSSTLFTLNGQAPFCSVFMYLNEAGEYKEELIILIEEFFKQRIDGMPNREGIPVTQAFPKLLYVLQEDNYKPGTKYWYVTEQAIKCSSFRLTPDYISEKVMKQFKINGRGEGDCYGCMGCRSFLTPDSTTDGYGNIARAKNYDPTKPKYYGRFNGGVVSMNLPDIAFASGGDVNKFWEIFEERLDIAHEGLQTRIRRLERTKASVAPILWMDGAISRLDANDTLYDLVHNNYMTISLGYVGLYECVRIMTGQNQTEEIGQKFALEVMQKMNDTCAQWRAEENVGYSVYGTPAESLAYKFATKTKEQYPEEFYEFFGDKKYFENSYHLPSFLEIDPFEKITLEGQLQQLSPGGCLSYVESVDMSKNIEALYPIVEHIYNSIMYCEINMKTSYCRVCGESQTIDVHKDENGDTWWECANCGNTDTNTMDVAARTCGYIGTNWWNDGKTQEIANRYIHLDDHEV